VSVLDFVPTLEKKVHYGIKESFVKTKKIPHAERNINEGFVGATKPFKNVSRQLTIDLNVF
jgi:hypothetical protein